MDFRQLEVFCAVVEWNSFSMAAVHLNVSQPTISNHLTNLESFLGTKLIARTTKTLSLTDQGREFYHYAKQLLRLRDKTLGEFLYMNNKKLLLGVSSVPGVFLMPEYVAKFKSIHPDIVFDITQSDSRRIISKIEDGILDMGIVGSKMSTDELITLPIYKDEMMIAAPNTEKYREFKETNAPVKEILKSPYIVREDGSATRTDTESYMHSVGLDPSNLNIVAHMDNLSAILSSIENGLGISILSDLVTKKSVERGSMLTFPLTKSGTFRQYYLIYRKEKEEISPYREFIEFIRNL
ncbi:MAG: LysR family transcriptional regulator [Eubacterium sp.]|nr:LysR family transcriptional regulator [Eubacterium sp.]